MSFRLTMKPAYLSDFVGLPAGIGKKLSTTVRELVTNPFEAHKVKKLKGYPGLFRARLDNYRLIYAACGKNKVVELIAVGPRSEIYQRFQRSSDLPDLPLPELYNEMMPPPPHVEELEILVTQTPPSTEEGLPAFDQDFLREAKIPVEYHAELLACRTDEDLFACNVPEAQKMRLLDRLYPKPIEAVQAQPNLLVSDIDDLDRYYQGELTTFLLELDAEQEALARRSLEGPALVKGGPGSGKSTVALYRVKAILEREPQARILFTTYTRTLTRVSSELLQQLLGGASGRVDVRTADSLATALLKQTFEVLPPAARRKALRRVRHKVSAQEDDLEAFLEAGAVEGLPEDYLLEEFDWVIEGQGLVDLQGYLDCERAGRGIAFDSALRRRVWSLYQDYLKMLPRPALSWGEIRLKALQKSAQLDDAQRYDYVLVDEAQDLTPVALRLVLSMAKDVRGVFLTADAGQSLYNRGFHWNRVHRDLKLVGRTRLLKRNYRSTREIGLALAALWKDDPRGTDGDTLQQSFVRQGTRPTIATFANRSAETAWVATQIRKAARELGLSVASAAVLCPNKNSGEEIVELLRREGVRAEWMSGDDVRLDVPAVKVLTMHSAKGLEFPIVALPALEEGLLPSPLRPGDDPDLHHQSQRRLLLVAASRAMRRLFLSARAEVVSPYLKALSGPEWEKAREAK